MRDQLGKFIKGSPTSPSTEFKKGMHASPANEFKKGHIPWIKGRHQTEEAKWKCSIASRGNHHHLIHPNLEMSENLAYILGVIYGDGYFTFLKRSWRVGLHVNEIEFTRGFREALSRIGLRPSKIRTSLEFSEHGVKQRYRVEAYSKAFHDFFEELSFDQLKAELLARQNLVWSFLRGLYESEGTRFYREGHGLNVVVLHNTDYKLIQLSKALLDYLGFSYSIVIRKPYDNRKPLYRLVLRGSSQRKEEFLGSLNPCIKASKGEKALRLDIFSRVF